MKERGLFDEEERLNVLSKLGDNLETLNKKINWELFRPILKKALKKEAKGLGGRPAYDYVMMFKIIILQRLYNISDEHSRIPDQWSIIIYEIFRIRNKR